MDQKKSAEPILLNPGVLGIVEVRIPVPWGHIAGKAWGDPKGQRVLAVHGWMDNAGTFDKLVPLLPRSLYIVAIEMPGHGRSSHLPHGIPYHYVDFVTTIRRVVRHLKWEKFDFMGHSMGASLGLVFSILFPSSVRRLVLLDLIKPVTDDGKECLIKFRDGIASFQSLDKIQKQHDIMPPAYPYEEVVQRLIDYTHYSNYKLTEGGAKTMLVRGARQISETEWTYNRDQRMMSSAILRFTHSTYCDLAQHLRCHVLLVRADAHAASGGDNKVHVDAVVEIYSKRCASFKMVFVPGNHFVHLNEPHFLAGDVKDFLLKDIQE